MLFRSAPLITENGLGIAVDSLDQIHEAVSALTPEVYRQMAENVRAMGEKVRGGYFFRTAAERAISDLKR